MNRTKHIKAAFLLLVFSMHTLVGLACSVGIQVGATTTDHHVDNQAHSHDRLHQHKGVSSHAHDHGDVTGKEHGHEASVPLHAHSTTGTHEDSEEKDDCCTDEVIEISMLDKALTSAHAQVSIPSTSVVFTLYAFLLTTYNFDFSLLKLKPPNFRSWPLATHTDLRIAIQSFQI